MRKLVFVSVLLLLCGTGVHAAESAVQKKFDAFCCEWMKKLDVREHRNRAAIHWTAGPDGVYGEYVGYGHEHSCRVKMPTGSGSSPIGIIVYREFVYRKSGRSTAEAVKNPPRPVRATEVTEIFRYSNGKWVY